MNKKIKSHTGFRNDKLFCFNCGGSYDIHLPQPLKMAEVIMKEFNREHKNCKPVWKDPVNENAETKPVYVNENWWYENGEHGISSKTIFNLLTHGSKIKNDTPCHPSDPDDFRRCYLLFKAIPQWKDRLFELKSLSPVWSNLVDNWDKLTEMLEEQLKTIEDNGMFKFMQQLGC